MKYVRESYEAFVNFVERESQHRTKRGEICKMPMRFVFFAVSKHLSLSYDFQRKEHEELLGILKSYSDRSRKI